MERSYWWEQMVAMHKGGEYKVGAREKFQCSICGSSYTKNYDLRKHMKSHTGETFCHICQRSYSNVQNYRMHMLFVHKIGTGRQT
ncbi:unnamed protein product [Bemisia tabaci]|uniref:C2H2-type domain-containing protein n=1 Tax=Bemisia tabaci TaxID=7038 RepID=A0A9P0F4U8_BEMTA|nr:unnamed protein product [Bemisia tabaci]